MNIQEYEDGGTLVLKISGKVDAYCGDDFSDYVTQACRKSSHVRMDLENVPYFSSAGLRGLIMGYKILRLKNGIMELTGVNPSLMSIIRNTGFERNLVINPEKGGSDPGAFGGEKREASGGTVSPETESILKRHYGNSEPSPDWVMALPQAAQTSRLLIVACHEKTTAWVSLHEKEDTDGSFNMIMTTVGFIGKNGLGDGNGDKKTPAGSFPYRRPLFNAFDDRRPFTDGTVAIPRDKLNFLESHVSDDCLIVIDTLENLGGWF